jgi:type IV secretion system protein VirB9
MTVITSKRTYHFDIKSGEYDGKADEELVYTVRFYYPQVGQALPIPPQLRAPAPPPVPPQFRAPAPSMTRSGQPRVPQPKIRIDDDPKDPKVLAIYGNPENLDINLNFSMAGRTRSLMPLKVYDDGKRTFFQFKNNNSVVPTISMVDPFGVETPLSYTIEKDYVVVGAVARQFTLRLANGLICIYNNTILQGQ